MKIKIKSSNTAALLISTSMLITFFIVFLIIDIEIEQLLVTSFILALIVYISARLVIARFVLYRLKPIYEIILNKNVSIESLSKQFRDTEMFGAIEDDITSWVEKKSEEIVNLKEMENYRKEFLGNVSHELKTPLFTLQGYVLTLLDGGISDPSINVKFLKNADKNIERLIAIVKDLESISELEHKVVNLERSKFEMVAFAKEIIESVAVKAEEKNITLSVMLHEPIYLFADKGRIAQVLINLVVNSIKYGREGGTTKIKFVDMYQKVMIEVEDDGIGIAEKHLPRIFERFYRVDKSRSREVGGTGLGLSICKHIIEAHGDNLNVRSEFGKGTTFYFTLKRYL